MEQAKAHLEKYLKEVPESKAAFNLMARIAEQDKDEETAAMYRDKALTAAEEKPFACDACGAVFTDWQNVCPSCGRPAQTQIA